MRPNGRVADVIFVLKTARDSPNDPIIAVPPPHFLPIQSVAITLFSVSLRPSFFNNFGTCPASILASRSAKRRA